MTEEITGRDLSLKLGEEIEGVVRDLNIAVERQSRRTLYCYAPWSNHPRPKLEIDVARKPGKWNDWIGGFFGDALGLVACVLSDDGANGRDPTAIKTAINWAKERYGLRSTYDREAWARTKADLERRQKERDARSARELGEARATAKGLWLAAHALTREDSGGCYLAARGISLSKLPRQPRAIRFSPQCRWYDTSTGEIGHIGPALLSAMTLPNGDFGSLHRIWVDPLKPGEKADLPVVRKMWPQSENCAIRIWRGASNLAEKKAGEEKVSEDVVVCEGVEDGLSIALMVPEKRIHAVGSLPGLLSYTPPKCARRLIVAADNDWGKPQAQALLDRACRRIEAEFRLPVFIARSPEGKDFNDLLRGHE